MLVRTKSDIAREIFCMLDLEDFGRTIYVMSTTERHRREVNANASTVRYLKTNEGNIVSEVNIVVYVWRHLERGREHNNLPGRNSDWKNPDSV